MNSESPDRAEEFHRAAIVAREHPGNPLRGTVVSVSTSLEIPIPDSVLGAVIEGTKEKFDIEKYADGLRYGTIYINMTQNEFIGVSWEDSPCAYDHGDFDEPVNTLPENLITVDELG